MKKIIKLHILPLFFFASLTLSFSANSEEQPLPSPLARTTSQTQVPPSEPPYDQKPKSFPEITAVATAAIHAAEHSVDVMVTIISLIGTAIAAIIALLGILGINEAKSLRARFRNATQEAINKIETASDEIVGRLRSDFNDKAEKLREEFEEVNTKLRETYEKLDTKATDTMRNIQELETIAEATVNQVNQIGLRKDYLQKATEELQAEVNREQGKIKDVALSMVLVANAMQLWQSAELSVDDEEKEGLRKDAISALDGVIESAEKSGNILLLTWSYSMRAFIYKTLGNLHSAINDSETAIELTIGFIQNKKPMSEEAKTGNDSRMTKALEETLSTKYYNLACYYCLTGSKDKWISNLEKAVLLDPQYKFRARADNDFKGVWENPDFLRLTA